MAFAQGQLFEDELPLVRSCPALNEIRLAEEIKELTIELKNSGRLNVHRIIVAARVPSLRRTLCGPLTESDSVLRWPTIPLSIATAFFSYVYTGRVELTEANARGLVELARMMQLANLENWGVRFIASSVSLDNVASVWDFAKSLSIGPLEQTCMHLMRSQFANLVCSDLFVHLPVYTILALLQDDNMVVDSEEAVFAAISCWVCPDKDDANDRLKVHAPTLLKEVRWHQTTHRFRNGLVQGHKMFQNSLGFEQWIGTPDEDKPPCPFNSQNRTQQIYEIRPKPELFLLFGEDKDGTKWSARCFDAEICKEERAADMEKREYASYSVVDDSIFVVGGCTAQQHYSTYVDEFLVRERRWRRRAPLAVGRKYHAAAVVRAGRTCQTLLGIFGGHNGLPFSSCEVYDVSQDGWFKLPDLREKRSSAAAACLPGDSRVFVFGGCSDSSTHASVEFCQLGADWQVRATAASTEDFWRPAASMRTARYGLAAAAFRGRILTAGGHGNGNNLKVVELFSLPDANSPRGQWTDLAEMNQSRWYFTLLTSSNAVFALGSDDGQRNTVETLNAPRGSPDTGNDVTSWRWSFKDPVETLSQIWGAAVISL